LSALDLLLMDQGGKTCPCGAKAEARLVVSLREINDKGAFFKGSKSIQRGVSLCAECGVERWERYRAAALAEQGTTP
jgi:hypothetical protein